MATKRHRSRPSRSSEPTSSPARGPHFPFLALLAWTPLLARWLVPTEGTSLGDTLWLTTLTFLVTIAVAWHRLRAQETVRFDRFDAAVCLLCAAHVISAVWVVATEGHKRAATNMLWEWTAVAVQFLLIRWTLTESLRTVFLRVFVALWIAQSGFGIWQHFVWYPAMVEQYEQMRTELDALNSGSSAGGLSGFDRELRLREVQASFHEQGIPMSGPSRLQFEGRLKDSADPVGFFALTNTFAGFLAMLVVLLWGMVLPAWKSRATLIVTGGLIGVAGWCLLLTKSRTAMCAAVAGLVMTTVLQQLQSRSSDQVRRFLLAVVVLPAVAGVLLMTIVVSGGIDSDVLSDAPKSLEYRLQYWKATASVIADHPLSGTGPGNFRDAYLTHKLPESSEEIADPHNFLLDVTANAGVLGLAALVYLLVLVTWSVQKTIRPITAGQNGDPTREVSHWFAPLVIIAAAAVVLGWGWLAEAQFDLRVAIVSVVAAVLAFAADSRFVPTRPLPLAGIAGSLAALLVHLLGAGGIAMPAVTGGFLVLAALLSSPIETDADESLSERNRLMSLAFVAVAAIALVGCGKSAFLPVLTSSTSLRQGDYVVVSRGDAAAAARAYTAASEQDSLTPEPFLRLASLALQQFRVSHDVQQLADSLEYLEQARERSPLSAMIQREIGERFLQLGQAADPGGIQKPEECFQSAAEWYRKALELYPTNSRWTAEHAEVLSLSGQAREAAAMAHRALQLDDLNRELAHNDRVLPQETRDILESITADDPEQ